MIEFMDETSDNVLGIRFTGKLTEADYEQVLGPRIATATQRFGRVRALIYMDDDFRGWDMKAAWANTKLDFQFRNSLEKVAVVGAPRWEEWCVRVAGLVVRGELRTFPPEQIADAWRWLRS
jgi:hypothetical protein